MKWYFKLLIGLIILGTIIGLSYRETLVWRYPSYVRHYQKIMRNISSEEYIMRLNNFTSKSSDYPYSPKYEQLLKYLGNNLKYPETQIEHDMVTNFRTTNPNHEDAIEILKFGLGRCGEFVIVYTALCITEGYDTRIILDKNDHMWVELWTIPPSNAPKGGRWDNVPYQWMHIEVTDGATWCKNNPDKNPIDCPMINDPYRYYIYNKETDRYEKKIGDKLVEMKEIWAIQSCSAERIEEDYQWKG